jgi:hypothetical protein
VKSLRRILTLRWPLGCAGGVALALGLGHDKPWLIAGASAIIGLAFLLSEATKLEWLNPPLTVMALGAFVTGIANAVGFLSIDGPNRDEFFLYAADQHLILAALLGFAGAVLPLVGGRAALRSRTIAALFAAAPRVVGSLPERGFVPTLVVIGLVGVAVNLSHALPELGTITAIVYLSPTLAAFLLARRGAAGEAPRALGAGVVVAVAEAVRAALFAYLRADTILPIVAVLLGAISGARSLRPLRSGTLIPVYTVLVAFVIFFGTFGRVRARSGTGVTRVGQLLQGYEQANDADRSAVSLAARLTNFNQLSQVGRLVEEDGFYRGATLEYLAYAFVPRFVWPDKPKIATGAWFALRIGQAWVLPDGRISNSVNMTIPGELYLNFGWPGVVGGCLIFGAMLGLLWTKTEFWRDRKNDVGAAFGCYLLWTALGATADLQIVVTLLAMYCAFAGISVVIRVATQSSSRTERPGRTSPFFPVR